MTRSLLAANSHVGTLVSQPLAGMPECLHGGFQLPELLFTSEHGELEVLLTLSLPSHPLPIACRELRRLGGEAIPAHADLPWSYRTNLLLKLCLSNWLPPQ